jgi:hypothetical protein
LANGLIASGLAMSIAGSSRPSFIRMPSATTRSMSLYCSRPISPLTISSDAPLFR